MSTVWLGFLASGLLLGSAAAATPAGGASAVCFEFRDAAAHESRSVLHYRAIEFRTSPVRPIGGDFQAPAGSQYGVVPVGPAPETALAVVWAAKADGGPLLWLDDNGDGRLKAEERRPFSGGQIEISASITVGSQPEVKPIRRTLIFRRTLFGEGLRYAVRGYASGTLDLGGSKHPAILTDGNADGLLDTVGQDRVWLDLNQDGRFDPLVEQFPLGKPITKAGQVFVVSSDPTASAVRARQRSGAEGRLRLDLAAKSEQAKPPKKVAVELVSDLGELAMVEQFGQPATVPAGDYFISALRLDLADGGGETWTYSFRSDRRQTFSVPAGHETRVAVLSTLVMQVTLNGPNDGVRPAETVTITPRLIADDSLYLSSCAIARDGVSRSADRGAEIVLLSPDGREVSRGMSGFS